MNLRKLKRLTSVVLSLSMVFSMNMTAFAMETAPTEPVAEETSHEHVLAVDESQSTPATCGEEGVEVKVCECGYSETETVAATGEHTQESKLDETTNEVVTSCTECGKELARAPYEDNFDLAAEGQTTGSDTSDGTQDAACADHVIEAVKRVAPTCFTEGKAAHYKCVGSDDQSGCGKLYRTRTDAENDQRPVQDADLVIAELEHKDTAIPEEAATCTEDGHIAYYTCTICNNKYASIEDLYNDEDGQTGHLTDEQIKTPATGHSYWTPGETEGEKISTIQLQGWENFNPEDIDNEDLGITATRACNNCTYSQQADTVAVAKDEGTVDCTAAEGATVNYTVTATFTNSAENPSDTKQDTDEVEVAETKTVNGHSYKYEFTWPADVSTLLTKTDDGKLAYADASVAKVTANRVCAVCNDTPTHPVDATLSSTEVAEGYVLKCYPETKNFIAEADFDGTKKQSESKAISLPTGLHDLDYQEKKDATCEEAGWYAHYICMNEDCSGKFWDEDTPVVNESDIAIPALGHTILPPEYAFAEGSDIVTATFKCRRSDNADCGIVISKTVPAENVNLEEGTSSNPNAVCGTNVTMSYKVEGFEFDRNVVKVGDKWQEKDKDDPTYSPTIYNGAVTREMPVQHKFDTVSVEWAGTGTPDDDDSSITYYDPEDGIKATLSCSNTGCDGVVLLASEGATKPELPAGKTEIILNEGAVLTLGDLDTNPENGYEAADCSAGGKDVYPVTITGVTSDAANTEINVTDKNITNNTRKSGHKYIITELEGNTESDTPAVTSIKIECALGNQCPDTVDGNPVNITDLTALTITYPDATAEEAGDVQQVTCTTDGVKVWAVDVTVTAAGKKAFKEYAADNTGKRWTLSKDVTATGHDFTAEPEWDWSDYGEEEGSNFVPFEGEENKVHATFTCKNANCGGEEHKATEPDAEDTVYSKVDDKRVMVASVKPEVDKTEYTDCNTTGFIKHTATANNKTSEKIQAVNGHVWNTVEWSEWDYVLNASGEKTYKDVEVGTEPNKVTVKVPIKTITASRTCSICDTTENFAENEDVPNSIKGGVSVTDQDTEANSCTRAGSTLYFAKLTIDNGDGTSEVVENNIPHIHVYKATGHNYDIEWTWYGLTEKDGDEVEVMDANKAQIIEYTSAAAEKSCQNTPCTKTIAATEDKFLATCINGDKGVSCDKTDVFKYEATATFEDDPEEGYSAQEMIIHEKTGHDYVWTIETWPENEEVKEGQHTVDVKGICQNNTKWHIVTIPDVTLTVTEEGIEQAAATCIAGPTLQVTGTFTGTIEVDGENKTYTGTARYDQPDGDPVPTAHKYTVAKPVWTSLKETKRDDENVTYTMDALVVCDHAATDATHNKPDVKITAVATLENVKDIDCSKDYDITYTLSIDGQNGDDADPSLEGIVIQDDTTKDGITAVVHHAKGDHSLLRHPEVKGTCVAEGHNAYYECKVCHRTYSNALANNEITVVPGAPLGHQYGDPVFVWDEEGKTANAVFNCIRPGCQETYTGHTRIFEAEVHTEEGSIFYDPEPECIGTGVSGTGYYSVELVWDKVPSNEFKNGAEYYGDLSATAPAGDHREDKENPGHCEWCGGEIANLVSVTFKVDNTDILKSSYAKEGTTAANITVPAAPNRSGYEFKGWKVNAAADVFTSEAVKAEIVKALANGNVTVTAVYDKIATKGSVVVEYMKVVTKDTTDGNVTTQEDVLEKIGIADKTYEGEIGTYVTVKTADADITDETLIFSHWAVKDGAKLTTDTTYNVYLQSAEQILLQAVYVTDENKVEKAEPTVVMSNSYKSNVGGVNKVSFVATMNIPEGYMLVKSGILYSVNAKFADPENKSLMVVGSSDAAVYDKAFANTDGKTNILTMPVGANTTTVVYARGYVICTNADGEQVTVYADAIASGSYDGLPDLTEVR